MTWRDEYVAAVEAENEVLRDRIETLESLLGLTFDYPPILGLTGQEGRLFRFLVSRDVLTKDAALTCLYSHRPDGDEAEAKIVDVLIYKLRRKLKPFGIAISTQWGIGYFMTNEAKAAVALLMPKRKVAA